MYPAIRGIFVGLSGAATLDTGILMLFAALTGGNFLSVAGHRGTLRWLVTPAVSRVFCSLPCASAFNAGVLGFKYART